jgi:hypothetical protein
MQPRKLLLAALLLATPTTAEPPRFQRVHADWGIDHQHHSAASGRYYMVETNGGGVTLFDADDDGDPDLFFADGAPLPGYEGPEPRSRLYRNDGARFVEMAEALPLEGVYASGAVAGDLDGDGDLDLYVTAFGPNRVLRNRGDGTFETVADTGAEDGRWSASAALADADGDGDLDVYVANYVDFRLDHNIACGDPRRGLRGYCGPDVYSGEGDAFFRNRGDGTFEDATARAGLGGATGAGLAVVWSDLDDDGHPDLYVANDLTPNFLFRNRGDSTFEDRSLLSGTAYGPRGTAEAGMGIAPGDFDGDGRLDLVVTNYEGETQALYGQRGPLLFTDLRFAAGLAEPTLRQLTFGVGTADLDHDGDLDLAFANGHVRENAELFSAASRYRQPNQVFENLGQGRFRLADAGLAHAGASRGLAFGDLDGDGDLDLVITNVDEAPEVYENLHPGGGKDALRITFRRTTGERFGTGTKVFVTGGELQGRREVLAGSSYLSQDDLTVHFGTADQATVDVTVETPEGRRRTLRKVPTGRRLVWMD